MKREAFLYPTFGNFHMLGVKWDALYSVPVVAGGMAQSDMITDDPSGANLSMVLLAYVNLNCALLLILMALTFPEVAKFKKPAVVGLALITGIAIFLTS